MYLRIYVSIIYVSTYLRIYRIYVRTRMHACAFLFMYVCPYAFTSVYLDGCMHGCMDGCMYVCMHGGMHGGMYVIKWYDFVRVCILDLADSISVLNCLNHHYTVPHYTIELSMLHATVSQETACTACKNYPTSQHPPTHHSSPTTTWMYQKVNLAQKD